jgi:stage IV sporulation protein FB
LWGLSAQQGIEKVNIFDLPSLLSELFWINFVLGAFNLLPGFPMDGGRVFRALLAFRLDYIRATEIAVQVGRIIAFLILIWGLFANPLAIIIGLFLFIAGGQELSVLKIRHSFAGMKLRNLAVHNVRYVHEAATLKDFMDLVASRDQDHYPVVDQSGKVVGILRMTDLERMDSKDMGRLLVRDVAGKEVDVVDANLEVEKALGTLLSKDFVLLVDAGRIIGYITPGHLMEASKFYGIVKKR